MLTIFRTLPNRLKYCSWCFKLCIHMIPSGCTLRKIDFPCPGDFFRGNRSGVIEGDIDQGAPKYLPFSRVLVVFDHFSQVSLPFLWVPGLNSPWLFAARPPQASGMSAAGRKMWPKKNENKISKTFPKNIFRKIFLKKVGKFSKIEKSKFSKNQIFENRKIFEIFKIFEKIFFRKIFFGRKNFDRFFSMKFVRTIMFVNPHSSGMPPALPGVM